MVGKFGLKRGSAEHIQESEQPTNFCLAGLETLSWEQLFGRRRVTVASKNNAITADVAAVDARGNAGDGVD